MKKDWHEVLKEKFPTRVTVLVRKTEKETNSYTDKTFEMTSVNFKSYSALAHDILQKEMAETPRHLFVEKIQVLNNGKVLAEL